jgi:hypothetical protein
MGENATPNKTFCVTWDSLGLWAWLWIWVERIDFNQD